MYIRIKTFFRDLLPRRYQVPAKYWYCWVRGGLEEEMVLLKFIVRKNERAIDIGGNRGVYAYQLAKLGAKVEVFEPNPMCHNILTTWAANNPDINVRSVALSSCTGSANLHIPVDEFGIEHDASASIENGDFTQFRDQLVPLQTLDSFEFEDVKLIKIDVEGHELNVIEGAISTLTSSTPALLIEIEQRHNDKPINKVFDRILSFGYQGYFMSNGRLTALEKFDVGRDQLMTNFDKPKGPYINNFLFLHQDRLNGGEYVSLINR